jgi:hypothetical protein
MVNQVSIGGWGRRRAVLLPPRLLEKYSWTLPISLSGLPHLWIHDRHDPLVCVLCLCLRDSNQEQR